MRFPPSPALSACDSLDGIDDLDAYLARQGSLSHFPTPPLKKAPFVEVLELPDEYSESEYSDCDDSESRDYGYIATVFSEKASIDVSSSPIDTDAIQDILIRAELPLEVVALAFNILTALHSREAGRGNFEETPSDLLAVSALNLAVCYTDDHAPTSRWWSRCVCERTWTASLIEKTKMKLLLHLDFHLHSFGATDEIEKAIASFLPPLNAEIEEETSPLTFETTPEKQPLKLVTDGSTHWKHVQITPDSSAPNTAHPEINEHSATPFTQILPLL